MSKLGSKEQLLYDRVININARKIVFLSFLLLCIVFYNTVGQQIQQVQQDKKLLLKESEEKALSNGELRADATFLHEKLLFNSSGYINSLSQKVTKVTTVLLKGSTVSWNVAAQKRYAAVVQSSTLDTVIRLHLDTVTVYRDLYLGEQAGIVFSPLQDAIVEITAFANTAFLSNGDNSNNGSYTIKVYEVQANPEKITQIPYNTSSRIELKHVIALRKAREYSISLEQDIRVYIRLFSDEFDPLLELSDTYGRSTLSDDWQGDESIITLVSPKTDDYFITVSSFDGTHSGLYTLLVTTSENEIILEDNNNISQSDTQLLSQYYKEYSILMEEKAFRALDIHAIDGDIMLAFTTKEKQTIVQYTIKKTQSLSVPLFVNTKGEYLILLLSSTPVIVNYSLTVYK